VSDWFSGELYGKGAMIRSGFIAAGFVCLALVSAWGESVAGDSNAVLLSDDFTGYPTGQFFSVVGAHAEYHYLPETAPKGPWSVTAYRSEVDSQRAWRVFETDGKRVMAQMYKNKNKECHPMLKAGDPLWSDYTVDAQFTPLQADGRTGIAFRYHTNRCYYFAGLDGQKLVLLLIRDGSAFHVPNETTLAESPLTWAPGQVLNATIVVHGNHIRAEVEGAKVEADNDAFPAGGIALTSDAPTQYSLVRVHTSPTVKTAIDDQIKKRNDAEKTLQEQNPKPLVWKKMSLEGFGVGRNLRFGDLDGDGIQDVLVGQVQHHGPRDANSELSCMTALTFDGKKLWQLGEPNSWNDHLTNDVAFQVHDLDGDGKNEVVYCMNFEIIVADGATGKTKYKTATPETPAGMKAPYNKYPRILGDSICFADLRGQGRDGDILLKDRYSNLWALDEKLNVLWQAQLNTGHYPYPVDIDHDGKDEVAIGYSLYSHDGKPIWTLDKTLQDHADGVAVVSLHPETNEEPRFYCAASDEGMFVADLKGAILKHHFLGHVQNPALADFRPDLPGLESVTVNFWGNQGIIHFFNADGDVYHEFEPFTHGSMCLPINWTGHAGEFVVLSANTDTGGMFDGWGKRAVVFPPDGHPDMCYAVLDVTGDCRDEVVVWDPHELWVYTQDDSPKPGRLFKPVRNPLYNYSNYQTTVSIPAWSVPDGRVVEQR